MILVLLDTNILLHPDMTHWRKILYSDKTDTDNTRYRYAWYLNPVKYIWYGKNLFWYNLDL